MTDDIIPPTVFSDNILADFSAVLSYELNYIQANRPAHEIEECYQRLNTVVGLGYAANLVEGSSFCEHESRSLLEKYLAVREDASRILPKETIKAISELIPKIVKNAIAAFSLIHFPEYYSYSNFGQTAIRLISHVQLHTIGSDEKLDAKAERIIRIIKNGAQ